MWGEIIIIQTRAIYVCSHTDNSVIVSKSRMAFQKLTFFFFLLNEKLLLFDHYILKFKILRFICNQKNQWRWSFMRLYWVIIYRKNISFYKTLDIFILLVLK